MKKSILLLCALALTLMSCSNDDDAPAPIDQIIGSWKFHKAFENDVEVTLDTCEYEEILIFAANGIFGGSYYEDLGSGTCELEESYEGTWSNQGSGNYAISTLDGTETEQVTFENNTFYIEYTDTGLGTDPVIITYRDVYIRQ